ncbi:MAG: hypothetical protein IPK25_09375 [Saprospiraceae bacterium]|nr:hypothetical protein [Saprospiraceae bacterium]
MNFMTEFDPNVKEMMIYPQDIGRTILNFLNNAFYAPTIRYSAEKERGVSNPEKPWLNFLRIWKPAGFLFQ